MHLFASRRVANIAALAPAAARGYSAPTVLYASQPASSTSAVVTTTDAAQKGDVLVMWIGLTTSANTAVSSVTGASGTWVLGSVNALTASRHLQSAAMVLTADLPAGSNITINMASAESPFVIVERHSGLALDVNGAGQVGSGTPVDFTMSGLNSGQIEISVCMYINGGATASMNTAGWTQLATVIPGGGGIRSWYKRESGVTSDSVDITTSGTAYGINFRDMTSL